MSHDPQLRHTPTTNSAAPTTNSAAPTTSTPRTTSPPAIVARGVVRDRGRFVLGPLDFELPTGQVLGLVGPNGSGKTTLMRAILGAVLPDRGELQVLGQRPGSRKELVGAVLDSTYLVPDWTVPQTVQAISPFYDTWDQGLVERLVVQLGVPVDAKVKDLSRGETSKLKLALALAPSPCLLILDEPTSGLDPLAREQVLQVIREFMLVRGRTVLLSTHISEDLAQVCDRILILGQGKPVHYGEMAALTREFVRLEVPLHWCESLPLRIVGLRRLGSVATGLVRSDDVPRIPDGARMSEPSVDDVIKAFAVPQADSLAIARARVEGFFHWSNQRGTVQHDSAVQHDGTLPHEGTL